MNEEKKNMVVLKDLPSNIAKEAYVVLKPHVRIKQKVVDSNEESKDRWPLYIVKEAESVISNYLSNLENNKTIRNLEVEKIKKKYNKLRKFCIGLGLFIIMNLLLQIIR